MSETSEPGVTPQLTFTEQEHSDLVEFLNMMNKAKFELDLREAHKTANLHVKCVNLCKKIEAHIMEVKRVVQKPKDKK